MQLAPLMSSKGLTVVGMDSAHCHHWAASTSSRTLLSTPAFVLAEVEGDCALQMGAVRTTAQRIDTRKVLDFISLPPEEPGGLRRLISYRSWWLTIRAFLRSPVSSCNCA